MNRRRGISTFRLNGYIANSFVSVGEGHEFIFIVGALILAAVALPVVLIVLALHTRGQVGDLQQQLDRLRARVAAQVFVARTATPPSGLNTGGEVESGMRTISTTPGTSGRRISSWC